MPEAWAETDERDPGWVACCCKHHVDLRWTMKDPSIQRISMNPQLMFDGDRESGLPGPPFGGREMSRLRPDLWALECDCPMEDLVVIRWDDRA